MTLLIRMAFSNFKKSVCYPMTSQLRFISTSNKNRETSSVVGPITSAETECKDDTKSKDWVSYGFSNRDETEDKFAMHAHSFLGISVAFIFGGFFFAYRPDDLLSDWAEREAFLELRRREQLGLPLIDPDYLPRDQLILPTDEELGDTEIII